MPKGWGPKIRTARKYLIGAHRNLLGKRKRREVVKDMQVAFSKSLAAWLLKHKHKPDLTSGRHSLFRQFSVFAPPRLAKKISLLNRRLHLLQRTLPRLHDPGDTGVTEDQWDAAAEVCLNESAAFSTHIKLNKPLQKFRGETEDQPFFEYRPGLWVQFFERGWDKPATETGKVLKVQGDDIVLRVDDRAIKIIGPNDHPAKPASHPADDMDSPFERRRTWFDLLPQMRQVPLREHPYADHASSLFFTCPCCGYPTLRHHPTYRLPEGEYDPAVYSICILCDWADDWDQDDLNVDEVLHGANYEYSLAEARRNFESHSSMYRPDHNPFHAIHDQPAIRKLKQYALSQFDSMVGEQSVGKIYLLWAEARQAMATLGTLIEEEEKKFAETFSTVRDEDGGVHSRVYENKWEWNRFPYRVGEWVRDYVAGLVKVLWFGMSPEGYWVVTRRSTDSLREIGEISEVERLPSRPDDPVTAITLRRDWFDTHPEHNRGKMTCPCCGYPTQSRPISNERCQLCQWMDAGQDDHNSDELVGDANGTYTLKQARRNFDLGLTLFAPTDPMTFAEIQRKKDVIALKKKITALYYDLLQSSDPRHTDRAWKALETENALLKKLVGY
ncbi:MAG: hypothetical protein IID15_03035 [Candidatus Marinimicrobia bacterium]|nr:hypothetical protein [Candidatus Neomarinimicrobiota bacterium]